MPMESFCGSPLWDLNLTWYTNSPDFTPCFQKTVLAWVPCGILWLFTPLQIYLFIHSKRRKIPWTVLNIIEILLCTVLMLLAFADTMYGAIQYTNRNHYYPVDYYTPFIKFLSFLLADVFLIMGRRKGLHTSGLLFIFWLLMSISGLLSYNSVINYTFGKESLQHLNEYTFITTVIYFVLQLCLLFLSFFPDHSSYYKGQEIQEESPENKASFISQITFWWFNKMAILGHKRSLVKSDMWTLNKDDTMKSMIEHFDKYWMPIQTQINKLSRRFSVSTTSKKYKVNNANLDENGRIKVNITFPLLKAFSGQLFYSGLMKFVSSLVAFVNPMILQVVLSYVSSDEPLWKGLLFAFLMFFSAMVESFFNSQFEYHAYIVAMKIKSCLIAVIYRKSLTLSSSARKDFTVGEIVNLMSVDTQRIMEFIQIAHLIWAAPMQVAVAMFLLWQQIGIGSFGALLIILIIFPFNGVITAKLKMLQVQMMKRKDDRIKLMNEVLGGMKVLKLYAWEDSFKQQVTNIRNDEVQKLKKQAYLSSALTFVFFMLPYLMSMASFTIFVLISSENVLTPSRAFVSLSLFNLVRVPLGILPMLITYGAMAWVAMRRINKVVGSDELDPNSVSHRDNENDPVVVKQASFSWAKGGDLILHDLNFSIKEGSLVAVVGQVGSGKSSLLSALLGDMEKFAGYVNMKGSVAYVPQQAWMQNATLCNNILFNKQYDKNKYEQVIESCALKPDLEVLPGGDQIEIGEKGINLSGGQKQRISLARAVYNNAKIYFLDDPLSAVDSHVGKHIFDKVIGPKGLLKKKTRILVTHRITVLPYVDKILVLKDGTITESGSYAELLNKKGAFADFLLQFLTEEVDEPDSITAEDMSIVEEIVSKVGVTPEIERQFSKLHSDHEDSESFGDVEKFKRYFSQASTHEGSRRRMSKVFDKSQDTVVKSKQVGVRLTEAEFAEVGAVKLTVYLEYLKAIGYIGGLTTIIAYAICNAFSIGYSLWLSEWSNDGLDPKKLYDIDLRNLRLGVYGALGLGEIIFVFIASTALNLACLRGSRLLHDQMLFHVMHAPMSFFDTTPLGRILNRFAKDIDTTDITISFNIRMVIIQGFRTLATFIVISLETPLFLVAIIPIGALYYLIQRFYISTSRQLKRLESITRSPIYTHFSETITGTSSIRAYGVSQQFNDESNTRVDINNSCYYPSIVASRWLSIRLEFLGYCIVFLTALFAVLSRGAVSPGIVGLSISYALSVTGTLNMLVRSSSDVETNIVSVERCVEYSHLPTEAAWRIESTKPSLTWPTAGNVQFENYATRYREGLSLVLKGITCTINTGEKVGIIGRTGAGKSSLTLSLFRLIEAAEGAIIIDGIDIATLGLHDLRSKLTIIPQDPMLFTGSLRMNLDPFEQYSDEEVWRSLEHSHLKAFVSGVQAGLNHPVAEGGDNLSVGQRQLVCLARALLRKTKILVLDEATAAVDLETDELIQSTIRKEFADCTILTIAHRLNTIMDYDKIVVLDKGEVIEFDSPSDLLKNTESAFYSMAKDAGLV